MSYIFQTYRNLIKIISCNKIFLKLILLVFVFSFITIMLINFNPRERLLFIEANNKINPNSNCLLMQETIDYPICKIGNGKVSAIVLGDSFGNSLFSAVAKTNTYGATLQWTYAGCFAGYKTKKPRYKGCRKFIKDKLKELKNYQGIPVIFINEMATANNNDQLTENITFYKNIICNISKSNPVYIVKKTPAMAVNVPKYLAIIDKDYSIPIEDYHEQSITISPILNVLDTDCKAVILDPTPFLCKQGKCLGSKNKKPLYYDKGHMNEYGNSFLIPLFQQVFK